MIWFAFTRSYMGSEFGAVAMPEIGGRHEAASGHHLWHSGLRISLPIRARETPSDDEDGRRRTIPFLRLHPMSFHKEDTAWLA